MHERHRHSTCFDQFLLQLSYSARNILLEFSLVLTFFLVHQRVDVMLLCFYLLNSFLVAARCGELLELPEHVTISPTAMAMHTDVNLELRQRYFLDRTTVPSLILLAKDFTL